MADFTMPALGADMEQGKLVEWRVKAGDRVRSGDVIAVVETHKGAIDVECFLDGVIDGLAPIGAELPVGAVLAHVHSDGEATAPAEPPPPVPPPMTPRARVSPAARQRAAELGIVADTLHGSGVDGSVTLADVEQAASARPVQQAPRTARSGFDPALMRQAIASAMARSKREIPHYYLSTTVDFGAAQAWLDAYNATREPVGRLLPATLLLKACAGALTQVPQLNGFWRNDAFEPAAAIHLGWAIALRGGGLVAPAIRDTDRKALPQLMDALRDLVLRARSGGLRSSEVTDPTLTVTSLGERGADSVLGVIYPPQVAIVGFGRVVVRPWVLGAEVLPRPVVAVTLAADHRASDGHTGGLLLAAIDRALQDPANL